MARDRTRPLHAPGPPESSPEVLILLGRVSGELQQMNERMGEMGSALRAQQAALEELQQSNAADHAETAMKLGALGEAVDTLKVTVSTLSQAPRGGGSSEGRKDSPLETWGKAFTFARTWWPGLVAAAAAVWAFVERMSSKGGTSPP